jgi:hypothetical protein
MDVCAGELMESAPSNATLRLGVLELGVGTKDIERTIARPWVARDRGPDLYVVGAAAIC